MKALLDTNIIIHREASKVLNQDIGILYRWLDRVKYTKCIHSISIKEIEKYKDAATVSTFKTKLEGYELINIPSPIQDEVFTISKVIDKNENDKNDSQLLNEVFIGRVYIIITEDKKIHTKAKLLNLSNRVFNINSFLEKVLSEKPELVNYKILNVRKMKFGHLNLADEFFSSLKEDYPEFESWFYKKYDDDAYVTINSKNQLVLSFLYLKIEDRNENYSDISPKFSNKKRLKIGTFKVISNGLRLGERFMKIIFDNALINNVEEIYVTIFNKRDEQKRLIDLLENWGFKFWGTKNSELVYVRSFEKKYNILNLKENYPFILKNSQTFLTPIKGDYHTELLPDSILYTESPEDFIEDLPHRNGINKIYVSRAIKPHPQKGDKLIFYRTGGFYKSVVTTIGLVEDVKYDFKNEEEFVQYCQKSSIFPEIKLREMWRYRSTKPFAVNFMYIYSFPHRINMKELIELGILQNSDDAPRGFKPISIEEFNLILSATRSDESFIVD